MTFLPLLIVALKVFAGMRDLTDTMVARSRPKGI